MWGGSIYPDGLSLYIGSNSILDVVRLMNVLTVRYGLKCILLTKKKGLI